MHTIEKELKEKYSNIRFLLLINDKFKRIYLTEFIVPFSLRNSGIGSSFMEDLTRLADQHGYQITLTPDSSYGGNVNRLKDFYQRFGFVFSKGKEKDFSHNELMHRNPKTVNEDETSGNDGTGMDKWESGVTRGKANPISNTGSWESGITRGKANPVFENYGSSKTLISVDIQPEYENYINFNINNWVNMINNHDGKIVFLYNGYDTLGMVNENDYKNWLYELGVDEDIIYGSATFYDKGYAFFRTCMDEGIDDEDTIGLIKMMIEYDINDSRELDEDFWNEFMERYGSENVRDLLEFSDNMINIPELMDFLSGFHNITICGGGKNECLKEVEIALMVLDKPYEKMDSFIYEKNNRLNETIINIKNIIKYLG